MANPMMHENIWFDKSKVESAERTYQEHRAKQVDGLVVQASQGGQSDLAGQIARARQTITNTLNTGVGLGIGMTVDSPELAARLGAVEKENAELRQVTADLQAAVSKLTARVNALEGGSSGAPKSTASAPPAASKQEEEEEDSDSDVDLFGDDDDEEDDSLAKMQAEKKAAQDAQKKTKKVVIAKSNIILDVKPWDDETDMAEIEKAVRTVQCDGLKWGASKLVPVGYGIKKLQITCVVEDDKVGTDLLEEEITKFEDLVQSVDIAAFNKV
ncbi:elongation factor 1-delta-like isoform X1 [Asterias rubens]|uniref:elongation factor 1-delta-like isoform X1 n=1 Tax=Asterias rubens TaxID=7604 RepID=UPI0014554C3C|nr:elongation factor 1-delta-like isoform X1 [Asterias rubens]XP_033636872.1 elongation factor 1-delta-like isoform X1 [Asterias rubens]XP_033636873.1 elongation factor 1-delta-like isoform X1 [Asterias rubens]